MFQKLYIFHFILIFWSWFSFSLLNFVNRGESCQQLGSVCGDHMAFCGADSYSKLHSQLDFTVDSSTAQPNHHRYKWAHKEGGACRLPTCLFRSWILDQIDEIWWVQACNLWVTRRTGWIIFKRWNCCCIWWNPLHEDFPPKILLQIHCSGTKIQVWWVWICKYSLLTHVRV